ncbi:type III pantothenate kinase [Ketobacter alkanivorans]|uniref:Type III pantothenate kinase n=1 Tax=Ketobacter alkanivorans TaxID=1917421 RepID=A0A2K9LIL3_9GAMM|nr:type III pantothenate kinase [Ketobacter alkanivorans]AUM12080.1 hypothetical protein Kalk_06450 [Ketobacter alkanivorans]
MTTLYLDFGNTRVKWRLGQKKDVVVQEYHEFEAWLQGLAGQSQITSAVVASVLGQARQAVLTEVVQRCLAVPVKRCVVTGEALGVRCAYADVSRLGIDRWLAVVAAWSREKSACVVADLGTAATLDFVDSAGVHAGGFIVSGLELSLRGLLSGTDNIKPSPSGFEMASLKPGINTAEAVYNGALHALVALIESSYQNLLKSSPEAKLILAGGDAPLVGSHLSSTYELAQGLVFDGMRLLEQAELLVDA